MQSFDSFRQLMDRNLPLKISFWVFFSSTLLAVFFSIVYTLIGCGGYGFQMPCSSYFNQNLIECHINSKDYCCGTYGSISCGGNLNCEQMPTPFTIPKCAGVLITSIVLQVLTLAALCAFCWLCSRARNAMLRGEDYGRMEGGQIEVAERGNNAFGGQGIQIG